MRIMRENRRKNKTGFPQFSYIFLIGQKKNPALHQARLKNRENYSMNRTATAVPSTRTPHMVASDTKKGNFVCPTP